MECFHGHCLSLPGWVNEWSFLGSVFLGHFHWVSAKNTGYWYGSHGLGWMAGHLPNILKATFYPTLLTVQMPTEHRFIECQSWKGPPGPSEPSFSSYSHCSVKKREWESNSIPITRIWWYHLLCRTLQWQPKVFSWCDHASWFAHNSPSSSLFLPCNYSEWPHSLSEVNQSGWETVWLP